MTGTGEPGTNHGIVIGGHARVADSALAAGAGAVAHRTADGSSTADGALAALDELRRRLEALEDTEAARAEAGALARELAAGQADGERVERRLARLRALIGDATALTGLVTAVHASVRAVTGG
ncbi:hypothetical protein ACIP98_26505 [Streptomyces sp. NPDC088354]|uniref:hypothetical protein n=1 Tax=unclassified Streptomyces TaxID=2593676 RepID=UPI0029B46F92|nr:hypothetical protein [Streptomyces sp. MI02-7b]MDX3071961.1 hypothetical protein [Streptomyces sp. MI02-7b]